jgi:hypothetical protein
LVSHVTRFEIPQEGKGSFHEDTNRTTEGHYFMAKVAGLATMKKMAMVDEVAKRLVVVYPGEHWQLDTTSVLAIV